MLIEDDALADPLVVSLLVVTVPQPIGDFAEPAVGKERGLDVLLLATLLAREFAVTDVEVVGTEVRPLALDA